MTSSNPSQNLYSDNSMFVIRAGGSSDLFMRIQESELWTDRDDGSDNFQNDIKFRVVPALYGGLPYVSIESVSNPGQFLVTQVNYDPVQYYPVTFGMNDGSETFKMNASFKIIK